MAHEACAFMAAAAPVAPENVHEARFWAGTATADAASEERKMPRVRTTIVEKSKWRRIYGEGIDTEEKLE